MKVLQSKVNFLGMLVLLVGCGDPLKEQQVIEEARVLGVRVASEGDVAGLVPGRPFSVDVLLAGSGGPIGGRTALSACVAKRSDRGVPVCEEDGFLNQVLDVGELPLESVVPEELPLGTAVVLLGVVCPESEPEVTGAPVEWSCSGGEPPVRFSFETTVIGATESHRNPVVSALTVSDEDEELLLEDAKSPPECSEGVPVVERSTDRRIKVSLSGVMEADEPVQLSHFSTAGRFERAFTFPKGDEEVVVEWESGDEPGPVKLYLVLRDGKGGVSWASWSFCQN